MRREKDANHIELNMTLENTYDNHHADPQVRFLQSV